MKTLIKNIGLLAGIVPEGVLRKEGTHMDEVGCIENAWLLIDGEDISAFGPSGDGGTLPESDWTIDAGGAIVMPSFCDSHTHIVYAGSREGEFEDKIRGLSYAQIAARGGGILNSADRLHDTSEDELYEQSMSRVREMMAMGTGAMEIKSGYGLSTEAELKMLRVIRRIRENGYQGAVPVAVNGSTVLLNELILNSFTEGLEKYTGADAFRIVTMENDTLFGSAAAAFLG